MHSLEELIHRLAKALRIESPPQAPEGPASTERLEPVQGPGAGAAMNLQPLAKDPR